MKGQKLGSFLFLLFFLMFVGLYFTASSGYYETEERKKMVLTNEQIARFEEDIQNGKQVDLEDYLQLNEKNYENAISDAALSLSTKLGQMVENGMNSLFQAMANAMEAEK